MKTTKQLARHIRQLYLARVSEALEIVVTDTETALLSIVLTAPEQYELLAAIQKAKDEGYQAIVIKTKEVS